MHSLRIDKNSVLSVPVWRQRWSVWVALTGKKTPRHVQSHVQRTFTGWEKRVYRVCRQLIVLLAFTGNRARLVKIQDVYIALLYHYVKL